MQYFAILLILNNTIINAFLTIKTTKIFYNNNNIRLLLKRSFSHQSTTRTPTSTSFINNNFNSPLFVGKSVYHRYPARLSSSIKMTLPTSTSSTASQDEVITAKIVKNTNDKIKQCASERILQNKLVSFPTETVYGLGANGLSQNAIEKIYIAKGRPKTSPLILHVLTISDALKLWDITSPAQNDLLVGLCNSFFPGPLTIISKANLTIVPDAVTANTGYVAVRSPNHPIARQLLLHSNGIPIAAPSANKFGHVSPTKAMHVYNDLKYEDVWIIDEDYNPDRIGVESTVAKVDFDNNSISILRHGAISAHDIYQCLICLKLDNVYTIQNANMVQTGNTVSEENKNHVSPGQTIRHYAPNIPCFILSNTTTTTTSLHMTQEQINILKSSIIIDYNQSLIKYKKCSLYYKDLSSDGNIKDATATLFDTLRWAESLNNGKRIYVPEIIIDNDMNIENDKDSLRLALNDRLTRAASGQIVDRIE